MSSIDKYSSLQQLIEKSIRVHYCLHIGTIKKMNKAQRMQIADQLINDPSVSAKLEEAGVTLEKFAQNNKNEKYVRIGREDEPINITVYDTQLAFCFDKVEDYSPDDNTVEDFASTVLSSNVLESKLWNGFLMRSLVQLIDIKKGYISDFKNKIFTSSAAKEMGLNFTHKYTKEKYIQQTPFLLERFYSAKQLSKSKKEVIQIRTSFITRSHKSGVSSESIVQDLHKALNVGYLSESLSELPHGNK